MKSKLIRLIHMPAGTPQASDFRLEETELPLMNKGQLELRPLYISVDPYLRVAMAGGHPPNINAGDIMNSRGIAEVVNSAHHDFRKGDIVMGYMEWRDLLIANAEGFSLIDPQGLSVSAFLSVLGSTGLSAYFALRDIGKPKPGETIVVSGAAGAVGSIAGQIGKIFGCKVIGIVGSDEKAGFVETGLGMDAAINYKADADIKATLGKLCPEGIDIYFDNVGGPISDAVIGMMNDYGRLVVCGSIANYNDTETSKGASLLPLVVYKKLLIQGFLITDFKEHFPEGRQQLRKWLDAGKLTYKETIVKGFEQLPQAFIDLFSGKNEGKLLVQI